MAKSVNKSAAPQIIRSQRELAKLLGDRDVAQINRWLKNDERWPFERKAPWSRDLLPEMLRWVASIVPSETITEEEADELLALRKEKLRQEIRKLNAAASREEIDLAISKREYVAVEEVKRWIGEHVTTAKNKFIGLAAAITPHLEGRDAAERQSIIDSRVLEILNDLAAA